MAEAVADSPIQEVPVQGNQQDQPQQRVEGPFSHIYEEFNDYFGNFIDAVNTRTNELTDRNETLEEQLDMLQKDTDKQLDELTAEKERICWILWRAANLRVNLSRRSIRMDEAFKRTQDDMDILSQEVMLSDTVRRLLATVLTRTHEQYEKLKTWNDELLQELIHVQEDHRILTKKYTALVLAWQDKTGMSPPNWRTEIEEEEGGAAARMQDRKRQLQQQREQKLVSGELAPLPLNVPANWAKFDPKDFTRTLVESLEAQGHRNLSPTRKPRAQNSAAAQMLAPNPSTVAPQNIFPPPRPLNSFGLNHDLRGHKAVTAVASNSVTSAPNVTASNANSSTAVAQIGTQAHRVCVESPSGDHEEEGEKLEPNLEDQAEELGEILFKRQVFNPEELHEHRLRVLDLHIQVERRAIEVGKDCGKNDEALRLDRRKRLDELGGRLQQEMDVNLGYLPLPDKPIPVPRWTLMRVREPVVAPAHPIKTEFGEIELDTILPPSAFVEDQAPVESQVVPEPPRDSSPWVDDDPHDPRREEIFVRILDRMERRARRERLAMLIEIGKRKALELHAGSESEGTPSQRLEDTGLSVTPHSNPRKSKYGERDSHDEGDESPASDLTDQEEKSRARKKRKLGQQKQDDASYRGRTTKPQQQKRVRKIPVAAAQTVAAAGGKTPKNPNTRWANSPKSKKDQPAMTKGKNKAIDSQVQITVPHAVAAVFSERSSTYTDDVEDEPESEEESDGSDPTWEQPRGRPGRVARLLTGSKAPSTVKSKSKRR